MMRCRLMTPALLLATAGPVGAQISVGPNVLVTSDAPDLPHFEMILAADPENADRLMACSMVMSVPDRVGTDVATYVSVDRGRSWRRTRIVRARRHDREAWDPDCTYGPDGVAYTMAEVIDSAGRPYVQVDRSTDGGMTWSASSRIKHFERMFLAADHTRGPRRGWLYFHGQSGVRFTEGEKSSTSGIGLHISPSGGPTSVTNFIMPGRRNYVVGPGPGVVLSDGTYVGIFGEFRDYYQPDGSSELQDNLLGRPGSARANGWMKVVRVPPDSAVASIAPNVVTVGEWFSPWPGWNKSALIHLTADRSNGPFKDRLYATWADVRSGRGEVYLAASSDSGKTWSQPRRVSDDGLPLAAAGADNLQGIAAVSPAGVLGVCWYDRREHADNLSWTVRCTASLDGGDTFLPSVAVSTVPYTPARADRMWLRGRAAAGQHGGAARGELGVHSFNFSGGHTVGLAADAAGDFHPLWTGNPTGTPQLWTATVSVPGKAAKNGGGALAALADVSPKLSVTMVNATYRPKARRLEAELYLRNTSKDTISGPVVLRVLAVESEFGVATLANADNRGTGAGAVYDFTKLVPGGRLLPEQETGRRRIRIDVKLSLPVRPTVDAVAGIAVLTTKVLATPPSRDPPPVAGHAAN